MKKTILIFIILLIQINLLFSGNNSKEKNTNTDTKKVKTKNTVISLLSATYLGDNKALVEWEGLNNESIQYMVYRSSTILDKPEKLDATLLIKTLTFNQTAFTDVLAVPGDYYYAVTLLDKDFKEDKTLIPEQNYITTPVTIEAKTILPVNSLYAVQEGNNIILTWIDSGADSYNIYRSDQVISNQAALSSAVLIENVTPGLQRFADQTVQNNGNYYYAVINVKAQQEEIIFSKEANYLTDPVNFIKPVVKETPAPVKEEPPVQPAVEEKKEEPVTVETNKPVVPPPVIKKKTAKKAVKPQIDYQARLRTILDEYYNKNDYKNCIKRLINFLNTGAPYRLKTKAKLFLGKAYHNDGQYKKALKVLIQVKDIYPDETDFWIINSVKKLE